MEMKHKVSFQGSEYCSCFVVQILISRSCLLACVIINFTVLKALESNGRAFQLIWIWVGWSDNQNVIPEMDRRNLKQCYKNTYMKILFYSLH